MLCWGSRGKAPLIVWLDTDPCSKELTAIRPFLAGFSYGANVGDRATNHCVLQYHLLPIKFGTIYAPESWKTFNISDALNPKQLCRTHTPYIIVMSAEVAEDLCLAKQLVGPFPYRINQFAKKCSNCHQKSMYQTLVKYLESKNEIGSRLYSFRTLYYALHGSIRKFRWCLTCDLF